MIQLFNKEEPKTLRKNFTKEINSSGLQRLLYPPDRVCVNNTIINHINWYHNPSQQLDYSHWKPHHLKIQLISPDSLIGLFSIKCLSSWHLIGWRVPALREPFLRLPKQEGWGHPRHLLPVVFYQLYKSCQSYNWDHACTANKGKKKTCKTTESTKSTYFLTFHINVFVGTTILITMLYWIYNTARE